MFKNIKMLFNNRFNKTKCTISTSMKNIIFNFAHVILFIFLFSSCKKNIENSTVKIIETNSTITANISDLFKKFNVIQLAVNDSSLIGLRIEKIECCENKIFLLNRMHSHRNILCFDFDGNFLFKIDQIGQGPQEYTYMGGFFIDKLKERIILQTENNRYMFFDLNGKYIGETTANDTYFERQIIFLNDSTLAAYNDAELTPYGYNLLELDSETFNIRNKSNNIKEIFDNSDFFPLTMYNNRILYYCTNDTVYDISQFNIEEAVYCVNFGKKQQQLKKTLHSITPEEISKRIISEFYDRNFVFVSSIFENSSWIILSFLKHKTVGNPVSSFVLYDKNKDRTYTSEHIIFDIMNLSQLANIEVIGCDNDKVLLTINQDFSNKDIRKIKESRKLNDKEKKILIERTSEDNPLLIILE